MSTGWLKYTTQDMHELAQNRGFCFLSETVWEACPTDIKQKTGCPSRVCVRREKIKTRQRNLRKEVT